MTLSHSQPVNHVFSAERSTPYIANLPEIPLPEPGLPIPPDIGNLPEIPLPEPGLPIPPDIGNIPVIPLPEPGLPIPPDIGNIPVIPLPEPGLPIPPDIGNVPVIPLPEPGLPIPPGTGGTGFCSVRFLHALPEEARVSIQIDSRRFYSLLPYSQFTPYNRIPSGFHVITVTVPSVFGQNIVFQQSIPFRINDIVTMVILPDNGAVNLLPVYDFVCNTPARDSSCIRMCNVGENAPALDLMLADGRNVFSNVYFKETTAFKTIVPAVYSMYVIPSAPYMPEISPTAADGSPVVTPAVSHPLASLLLNVNPRTDYTIYIMGMYDLSIRAVVSERQK